MTKLEIKQRVLALLESTWSTVWVSAASREELADYLATRFRSGGGIWEVRADQEMAVDASQPSMRPVYVVHCGDHEPYSSGSQTEASAVAEVLNVLETELRSSKGPS